MRLVTGRMAAGRHDGDARQQLALAVRPTLRAPVADERELRLDVRGDQPGVVAERDLPLRLAGPRSSRAGTRASRRRPAGRPRGRNGGGSSRRRRPMAGRSRRPAAPARSTAPRMPASSGAFSSSRSPIPVSTRTRPAGVSISRQFSAWRSRCSGSVSSPTQRFQRSHGTGPKSAPASDRKVPAWTSATGNPPPRSCRQSTASFIATRPSPLPLRRSAARGLLGRWLDVAMEGGRGRLGLALVLGTELWRTVRALDRARHLEEADLADAHPEIQRDRQVGHVRQLERQVALPARVDIASCGVDQQAEPAERRLAFEASDEIVRQLDPLERLAEDELARVEDERLVVRDLEQLGQVGLRAADVDVRRSGCCGRRGRCGRGGGRPTTAAGRRGRTARCRRGRPRVAPGCRDRRGRSSRAYPAPRVAQSSAIVSRSANSVSTSRLRSSRSSKLW